MSQYHISLTFTADTAKAKAQVQELSKSLSNLALNTNLTDKSSIYQIDKQLQSASTAARQLQSALELALNPRTGKLDLSKFQDVLKKSGKTLKDFERDLTAIGPEGQHAFNTLCTSIMQAELPLKRTNKLVDKLWDSLKKTVTWQVTSTITHGLWGGVEKAYRYAQDLNQSLTDIQIVTGKSSDEMAQFAKSANQAAKSLSTTTTKYTEASLIYFQQGLNQKEVEERTALTVKMANVTGESVSTVSQQLTAVWNNFYDGSKSLEYYIDVMTALGAATASSSDEISEGLNKFAAVAETVGLSYEYAASALATVTATTRESADIVGNAFKTLFARIQGLKLGETLDDGTDLNKYSAALQSVGIDIKDVNGEIRDMDDILDEMGQKWATLNKDQQIALAQTVAGVRQYNQLVALMDNWSFFQANLNTAMTSTGTLTEQAEIYEKSWKAANERVRASAEGLYDSLINDEFFIDLANAAAGFLTILEDVIDSLGGVQGLLFAAGSIITKLASTQVANTLRDMAYNVKSLTGANQRDAIETKQLAGKLLYNQYDTGGDTSDAGYLVAEAEKERAKLQMQYINNADKLNESEVKNLQIIFDGEAALIDRMKTIDETTIKLREQNKEHQKSLELTLQEKNATIDSFNLVSKVKFKNKKGTESFLKQLNDDSLSKFVADSGDKNLQDSYNNLINKSQNLPKGKITQNAKFYYDLEKEYENFVNLVNSKRINIVDVKQEVTNFAKIQKELGRFKLAKTDSVPSITKDNLDYARDYGDLIQRISANLAGLKDVNGNALIDEQDVNKFTSLTDKIKNKINLTDTEIKELDALFQKFNTTLKQIDNPAALDNLIKKLNLTEKEAEEVKQLLTQIQQAQLSGGTGEEEMAQLLGVLKSKGEQGGELLGNAGKKDWADIATEISNAAMNLGMFATTLNSSIDAFSDGKTDMQDFTAGIGLFGSAVSSVTTLYSLFTTVLHIGAGPAGWAVAAIMAIVTAIALYMRHLENQVTEQEKMNAAVEDATKTAEELANNLNEVKNKINDVSDAFDKFHELKNNLDELTEGTTEWKNALAETQQQIKTIMEMYPELVGTYSQATGEQAFYIDPTTGLYTMGSWVEQYTQEKLVDEYIESLLASNSAKYQLNAIKQSEETNKIAQTTGAHLFQLQSATRNGDSGWEVFNSFMRAERTLLGYLTPEVPVWANEGPFQGWGANQINAMLEIGSQAVQDNINDILIAQKYGSNVKSIVEDALNNADWQQWDVDSEMIEFMINGFTNNIDVITDAYGEFGNSLINNISSINQQNYLLAQEILSTNTSFATMTADYRQAASILLANELKEIQNSEGYLAVWNGRIMDTLGRSISGTGAQFLAKALGNADLASDWVSDKDIAYNFEKTSLGNAIRDQYFALEGITVGSYDEYRSRDMKITGTDAQGKSLGEDYFVSYDTMLNTVLANYISSKELQIDDLMSKITSYETTTIAGIIGDFQYLSKDEMDSIANVVDDKYQLTEAYLKEVADVLGEDSFAETEQWVIDLQAKAAEYDAALARTRELQQQKAEADTVLAKGSKELDLDIEVLENYAEALSLTNEVYKDNPALAAKAAVASARFAQGMEDLRDALDDNLKVLSEWNDESFDTIEAATEIAQALEKILGVDVNAQFVKTYLKEIQALTKGGEEATEALRTLQSAAAREYVAKLAVDDSVKANFNALLADLEQRAANANYKVGIEADLNDSAYINGLNDMMKAGLVSAEQVEKAFGAIGWTPNIKYKAVNNPVVTSIDTDIYDKDNIVYSMHGNITTDNWTNVPYIENAGGGEPSFSYTPVQSKNNFNYNKKDDKGGGGNKKDPKSIDDKERYYELNETLDDLAKKLDLVDKKKSRAFGKSKSDLIKAEIALIDEEIATTEKLIDAITKDIPKDMANLAAFGATFDENNNLTNYDEIYAAEVGRYNAAIATGDESTIAAAEKRWELFEKYLTQYEATMDAYDDAIAQQTDNKIKKYEKLFEDLTYSIEVKLDIDEDQIKLLDHLLTMLEDKPFSAAEAIGLLGQKTQATLNQADHYAQGIKGLLDLHGMDEGTLQQVMDGTITEEQLKSEYGWSDEDIAKLREYSDGLMKSNEDLMKLRDTVQEQVVKTFQEWNEEMDRGINKIEHLTGVVEAYQNIIDLVGQETLGLDADFMKNMANTKVTTSQNGLRANVAKYEADMKALENANEEYRKAEARGDEESMRRWRQTINQLEEDTQSAHDAMLESWQATLEAANEAFEIAIDQTINTFEKAISGTYGSLETLQQVFDQQSEIMDRYVEDYEKIYELSKLNRDVTNSIDNTDNVRAKQALRELQQEINELQESDVQMSEYDLKHLRKKYELRLAEIALEEAQHAKSQVRMRRDSEGNYSYVFTADENKIEQARQNYEDALYEMQDLNTQYIREMQNNILQSEIALANALRALDRSKYKSDAEYYADVDRITQYYMGQRTYYLGELDKGLQNNQETYSRDWASYSEYTGYKISADDAYIDNFNETVYAQITGYESIQQAQQVFKEAAAKMVEDLDTAFKTWQSSIQLTMEIAGTSVQGFGDTAAEVLENVAEEAGEAAEDVQEDAESFSESFAQICEDVTDWQVAYSDAIGEVINSNTEMITSCGGLISLLSEVDGKLVSTGSQFSTTAAQIQAAAASIQAACAAAAAAASSVNSTSISTIPTTPTKTEEVEKKNKTFKVTSLSGSQGWSDRAFAVLQNNPMKAMDVSFQMSYGKKLMFGTTFGESLMIQPKTFNGQKWYYYGGYYYPASTLTAMATGGYTGEWGSEGKLAMLHQKELVLNATDTENMLKAVEIVRNIVKVIDLNAGTQSQGLGALSTGTAQVGDQVLEQAVTITAEFPNATDHNEIEMAFDSLINRASQFANRKNL